MPVTILQCSQCHCEFDEKSQYWFHNIQGEWLHLCNSTEYENVGSRAKKECLASTNQPHFKKE
jgi:hypothetical protein